MLMQALTRVAKDRTDPHRLIDSGHVTFLARISVGIVAVQPLQIRHLLGNRSNRLATFAERRSIELVTGGAKSGVADVIAPSRLKSAGGAVHDALVRRSDVERAVFGTCVGCLWSFHDKTAIKAFARAEVLLTDLVTDSAGYTVFGCGGLFRISFKRQVSEDLALVSADLGLVVRDGHVADGALVLDISRGF